MTSASITLRTLLQGAVCVYLGTWLPSEVIGVVLERGGVGTGLPMLCVLQNAMVIPLILFGYNPFEIITYTKQ